MSEDKVGLARKRAELIESLATPLAIEDRVRVQGELSVINAKIKALNTTLAAQLKATADQRKVAGLVEAQANAARARIKTELSGDEPGDYRSVVDAWIDAVLLRHDVDFTRSRAGKISLSVPSVWAKVLEVLIAGVYAGALGHPLPELPSVSPKAKKLRRR